MSKFAKLFDVEDTQVLYRLTTNDEGVPCVRVTTEIDGLEVSADCSFDGMELGKALSVAEKALSEVSQENADGFHSRMRERLGPDA